MADVETQRQALATQVGNVAGQPALAGAVEPVEQQPPQTGQVVAWAAVGVI